MTNAKSVKVESLKDYVGVLSDEEFMKLATDVYMITDFICKDYPKHKEWYFEKTLPTTISDDSRNILFIRNPDDEEEIIAMACLKKDEEEKKICTMYVSDKHRGLRLGAKLTEESLKWLGTTKPLITLADYKLDMFRGIIAKYDWELTEIVSGLYNDKYEELCFNGTLTQGATPPRKHIGLKLARAIDNIIDRKDL